ncbi:MAG: PAS domain S-box protein [Desulfomonile tiedjei]|nr:PAS domain S-box protein [Desulfomonile tiedjei]
MSGQELRAFDFTEAHYRVPESVTLEKVFADSIDLATIDTDPMTGSGSFKVSGTQAEGFHRLLNALPIPAMLVDQSYSAVFANEASEKINIDYRNMAGGPFFALFPHPRNALAVQVLVDKVFYEKKRQVSEGLLQVRGKKIWARMHFRSIKLDRDRLLLVLIEDLTLEKKQLFLIKKHGATLQTARDELERRVEDRTAELAATNWRLRQEIAERQRAEQELQRAHAELEKHVDQRTAELLAANKQLKLEVVERKRAEAALRESEEKYRTIVETIEEAYYELDNAGNFNFLNDSACKLLGHEKECLLGKDFRSSIHDHSLPDAHETFKKVLETGKPVNASHWKMVTKDGSERDMEVSVSLIRDSLGDPLGFRGIWRDVTGRRQAEEELFKVAKLESIGVLAGGIAHDFNNILTAIQGSVSLAKLTARPGDKVYHLLENAEKASTRAKDLTQQLLTFSRGGEPVRKACRIAGLVRDACEFTLRGSTVRCEFSIPKTVWTVNVDEGQISQVISNLVINAQQAMPQGGVIKMRVEDVVVAPEHGLPISPGPYVRISIEDHGRGIPEEHLSKIFDPYFTTKQKGSGLGLATSYSIIKKHDGLIAVSSTSGTGTTFDVYLPRSDDKIPEDNGTKLRLLTGKAKILLMDDEQIIGDLAKEILSMLGYDVDVATDGAEAVELYGKALKTEEPYDLVIVDLTVPGGMGGKEAIDILGKSDPKIRAIVSSGYSNDPIMANHEKHGFIGVVAKPYTVIELSEAVRRALVSDKKV